MISPTALSKCVGKPVHVRLALLGLRCSASCLLAAHPLDLEPVVLEDLDGARHLAEFVAALDAGNFRLQIVTRKAPPSRPSAD